MDVLSAIKKRRTTRSYLHKEVEFEKLINILDAGNAAPTAGNLQEWKFIIVLDEDVRSQIADLSKNQVWMTQAPVHLIVCSIPEHTKEFYGDRGDLYATQSTAAAIQNMLLAAEAQGVASAWIGAFDEAALKTLLKIPSNAQPQAIITLGYSIAHTDSPPKRPLEELLFFHEWGNKRKHIHIARKDYDVYLGKLLEKGKKILSK